jgi:hypothetical protein
VSKDIEDDPEICFVGIDSGIPKNPSRTRRAAPKRLPQPLAVVAFPD